MSGQVLLADEQLGDYLAGRGLAEPGGVTAVEPAGDGNINWVRRARLADGRSLIVKQARPALERFPEYRVSTERIVFEHRYYELAGKLPEAAICPKILDFDERERVLTMEDLGDAPRLDHRLARGEDPGDAPAALGRFLAAVHATSSPGLAERFQNDEMRGLHGDHIFALPLRENDFPLPAALRAEAERLWQDAELVAIADALHARYREPRGALVHGDVQAGNILLAPAGPKLLDAEIAHVGDPAFDVGILLAHLILPAVATRAPEPALRTGRRMWLAYQERLGGVLQVPFADVARYAGIELLRRTLGAARLEATDAPDAGRRVLTQATDWLRSPPAAL
ncbi:MAG: phosphotransferase [Myxococcales bacterium]|nr:phosphotransferase [Myxococcales bacterium]